MENAPKIARLFRAIRCQDLRAHGRACPEPLWPAGMGFAPVRKDRRELHGEICREGCALPKRIRKAVIILDMYTIKRNASYVCVCVMEINSYYISMYYGCVSVYSIYKYSYIHACMCILYVRIHAYVLLCIGLLVLHQRSKVSGPQTNQTTSGGEIPKNRTFTGV